MTRTGGLWGAPLLALVLVASSMGSTLVPAARAATTDPRVGCVPAAESTVGSPAATWTLAPTGPTLRWQRPAFAPTICRLVAFGGNDLFKGLSNDTWLFDPATGAWTKIAGTRTGPVKRDFGELAWDATGKRVILFGGRTIGAPPGRNILQDTWSFDPVKRTWVPLITDCRKNVCPPARLGGALVWSSAISKLVLFGGEQGIGTVLNDVWTFDTSWHRMTTNAGPSGRALFGMAQDEATGMLLVYGGADATNRSVRETWQLDPRTWQWRLLPTAASPVADAEVGMAWLPSLGAVVVTGGSSNYGTGLPDTTWMFDRSVPTWVRVETNQPVPSMHLDSTLTMDPCHGVAIFLGPPDQELPPTHSDYTWILR